MVQTQNKIRMEVRAVENMKVLPRVFILPDGVRVVITDSFVNCSKFEECLVYGGGSKIKKTNGIYHVKDPAITVSFRKATLKSLRDVKKLLEEIQPFEKLPEAEKLLIKYNYFSLKIYDKFARGKVLEFPTIAEIDNVIKMYKVPEPPGIYIYDTNMEKKLDPDQFQKIKYLRIYGHDIEFEKEVLVYQYLNVFNGTAELIYIPETTKVTTTNNEDDKKEFNLDAGWVLISAKSEE